MSCSSTAQAPRSTIQILQSRTVSILEPLNPGGSNAILDTATGVRTATALNVTTLLPPLPPSEEVPSPPLYPQAPLTPEMNEFLTNLLNLLR